MCFTFQNHLSNDEIFAQHNNLRVSMNYEIIRNLQDCLECQGCLFWKGEFLLAFTAKDISTLYFLPL